MIALRVCIDTALYGVDWDQSCVYKLHVKQ